MKIKNLSFINSKLYLDALKQLRLIGFICFGILSIFTVLIPIGTAINTYNSTFYDHASNVTPILVTTRESFFAMFFIFVLFTPLLTIYLFSFLTKRNACDYFHSFPQRRGCLYNTYFAAVTTWIFIFTFGTALISGITYGILSKYFVFSYLNLVKYTISIFVCSLLVAAAIALACSITGTIFTNIVVSGLILFLPRLITLIMVSIITSNLNILVPSKILPLLDYNYNLIFNSLSPVFSKSHADLYPLSGIIYTAILSVIYIGVGRLLFIKRKSEVAGNSSANRILQCIIRLCVAIPICMAPLKIIFSSVIGKTRISSSEVFSIFVLYLVAIIVMLLYELISTKKFHNVVRSLPSVGFLVLINIFILLVLTGIYQSQLNYKPEATDVQYITVGTTKSNDKMDYFEYAMSSKKITDKELIKFLVDNLAKNIEYEKTSYPANVYFSNTIDYSTIKELSSDDANKAYYQLIIGFKTGFTVKYRQIQLDMDTYNKYNSLLSSSEDIKDCYLNLPEYNKNLMSFYNGHNAKRTLTEKEFEDIYNTLKDEVKNLDYTQWHSLLYEKSNSISIQLNYNVNENQTITILPLTSYTPKALLKYMNYFNNSATDVGKLKEDLKKIVDGKVSYGMGLQVFNSDFTENSQDVFKGENSATTNAKKLYEAIDFNSLITVDSLTHKDQTLVNLNLYVNDDKTNYTTNSYRNYSIYFYIDNTKLDE